MVIKTGWPILALLLCLVSCASHPHNKAPVSWPAIYETAWSEVTQCWGVTPTTRQVVIVRTDCVDRGDGVQHFLRGTVGSQKQWATGQTSSTTVEVCPDLKALRHEFSEYVRRYAPDGSKYVNGSGKCWM